MAHHEKVVVDTKQLKSAETMWAAFQVASKIFIVFVCVVLIGLAVGTL